MLLLVFVVVVFREGLSVATHLPTSVSAEPVSVRIKSTCSTCIHVDAEWRVRFDQFDQIGLFLKDPEYKFAFKRWPNVWQILVIL